MAAYGKAIPSTVRGSFICTKCGKQAAAPSYTTGGSIPRGMHIPQFPNPTYGGKCPDSSSGNHVWEQTN